MNGIFEEDVMEILRGLEEIGREGYGEDIMETLRGLTKIVRNDTIREKMLNNPLYQKTLSDDDQAEVLDIVQAVLEKRKKDPDFIPWEALPNLEACPAVLIYLKENNVAFSMIPEVPGTYRLHF